MKWTYGQSDLCVQPMFSCDNKVKKERGNENKSMKTQNIITLMFVFV